MADFNALMNPGAIGQGITNSVYQGQEMARQGATQQAMAGYAKDPSQQNALLVASHDPRLGIQLGQYEQQRAAQAQEQQKEARAAQLRQAAANGDPQARAELAGIDFQAWNTLDAKAKADIEDRVEYIGQAALAVSQLPPEAQAAAWDQYVTQGAQRFPDLMEYRGKYSPQALQAALAQSGQVKEFLDLERPSYQVIPEGGTLVNTRDPGAVQQYQGMPTARQGTQISPAAADYLRTHPETWRQFEEKYGQGTARSVLGVG